MLRVAFIGYGNSVRNYHLPYLEHHPDIQVVRIFRREEDRVGDLDAEKFYPDIEFTSDLNTILLSNDIDLVAVCTHVDSHAYYSRLALQNNKHILVEKPFASSVQEAEAIFALAKEKHLLAVANQNRRYDSDFLTLKNVIASGKTGRPVEMVSHYDYFKPQVSKPEFDRLYGLAVHQIDQIVSLFGIPQDVHYDVRSLYYPGKSDDYIDIDLCYSGFKATVKCSIFVKIGTPKFILYGDKGAFIKYSSGHQAKAKHGPNRIALQQENKNNWGRLCYVDDAGGEYDESFPSAITDYGKLYEDIRLCIENNQTKPIKDDEVLAVMKILEGGLNAAMEAI